MKRETTPKNNGKGEPPQFCQKLERSVRDTTRGLTPPEYRVERPAMKEGESSIARASGHPQSITKQMIHSTREKGHPNRLSTEPATTMREGRQPRAIAPGQSAKANPRRQPRHEEQDSPPCRTTGEEELREEGQSTEVTRGTQRARQWDSQAVPDPEKNRRVTQGEETVQQCEQRGHSREHTTSRDSDRALAASRHEEHQAVYRTARNRPAGRLQQYSTSTATAEAK